MFLIFGVWNSMSTDTITYDDFLKVDMRVGKIIAAVVNEKARKPSYVLTIDFGNEIGIKTSSAQITDHYQLDNLIGQQVVAVVNFPVKLIAGVKSEVLVLGALSDINGVVLLKPSLEIPVGGKIH
jgi:tRNA-binding protein